MQKPRKLLRLIDSISLVNLRLDLESTLKRTPLRLREIVAGFSDRLPPKTLAYRKDRFFCSLMQQMKKQGRVKPVKGKWHIAKGR